MGFASLPQAVLISCGLLLPLLEQACCNQPPTISFPGTVASMVFVEENTPLDSELFNVTATDSDASDSLDIVVIGEESNKLVTLDLLPQSGNKRTARVLLKSRLDTDRSPHTRNLWFQASDGQTQDAGTIKLFITDVNDNPPFFQHLPYRLELPERTNQTNTVVYTFSASDPDEGPGRIILYSMTVQAQGADSTYNTTFKIREPFTGQVWLEQELDYESRAFYQYRVFAKDSGNPQCPGEQCYCNNITEPGVACEGLPTTFTVTVKDVQDTPPFFDGLPYITQLYENASIGSSVLTVSAMDGDRGVPNEVNFTIVDGDRYPFSIGPKTGEITVSQPGLDADTPEGRSYFITVKATEIEAQGQEQFGQTTATTQVSITVLDVNNNGPQFGQEVYYATVQENTPTGVPITINRTVTVTDKDQNTNSQFRLSVEKDGAPYLAFSTLPSSDTTVQGFTTVMITVNDSSLLDYEQRHSVTFQIKAKETETSEEFSNSTVVILSILDINDNSPYFPENQTTQVNVTEDAPKGTPLATLTATDKDSGIFGTVAYSLEDTFQGRFEIDETSGNLTVSGDLDRDAGDGKFSLVIVARDSVGVSQDSQRRSTRHPLQVRVLDVNDNAPVFQPHQTEVTVQENAEVNTTLLTLRATDIDQGQNGQVVYHVINTHSTTSPTTTTTQPPLFDIREITGEVFVKASMIDHPGLYNVTFTASDMGEVPKSATTSVIVDVKDVNGYPPKFVVPNQDLVNKTAGRVPSVTVYEEEDIGTFIIQLNATDADREQNGEVHYFLDPDLNGDFVSFHVDPISGNLSNRACLDSESGREKFQINLRAQDQGALLSLSTVIPFNIYLKDVDDSAPEFAQGAPLVLSVKEQAADVTVGFVNISTDKDRDPENRIACYYLYGGEMVSSFRLNQTTGELRLLTKLDRIQTLQVALKVKVTRNCSLEESHFLKGDRSNSTSSDTSTKSTCSSRSSSSSSSSSSTEAEARSVLEVKVEVLDINNHPPVFQKDGLTVGLLYDVAVGTEVTDLKDYTSDEDTPEYSKHMFRLLKFEESNSGSEQSLESAFAVSTNGSVLTRRLFLPDESGVFLLSVEAYDADNLTDTAKLTIYLVSNLQRVRLIFNKDPNQVNKIKADMVRKLGEVLKMTIIADKIATHINVDGTPDPKRTDVFIHARYISSGEIVPTSELVNAFDYNSRVFNIFQEYGVAYASPLEKTKQESEEDKERKVFIIVVIALVIVSVALVLVLFTSVRRYRRRLKAATTKAFVTSNSMPNNQIAPGTNKYYTSENPLFGKDVKPDDFHRPEDRDNDSLDDNAVDGGAKPRVEEEEEPAAEEQEVCMDMYDDDVGHLTPRNPLAMVLQEYDTQNTNAAAATKPHKKGPAPAVPRLTSHMAASMLGHRPDLGKSPLMGHAASGVGVGVASGKGRGKENKGFDYDLDNLQQSDI